MGNDKDLSWALKNGDLDRVQELIDVDVSKIEQLPRFFYQYQSFVSKYFRVLCQKQALMEEHLCI